MLRYHYAALTHQGKVRANNEDNFYVNGIWKKTAAENIFGTDGTAEEGYLLAAVCDGMGGQELGEVASLLAVEVLDQLYHRSPIIDTEPEQEFPDKRGRETNPEQAFPDDRGTETNPIHFAKNMFRIVRQKLQEPEPEGDEDIFFEKPVCLSDSVEKKEVDQEHLSFSDLEGIPRGGFLREDPDRYIETANLRICDEMCKRDKPMGTTFAALEFYEDQAVGVNLGDSPIFRFADGMLEELSVEHSPVGSLVRDGLITKEEAKVHPLKHKISQYLGIFPNDMVLVPAVTELIPAAENEQYLICSDGLTNMLQEEEICEVLSQKVSVKQKVRQLIQLAIDHGGKDNVTVVLVETQK